MKKKTSLLSLLLLPVILAGCGSEQATPIPAAIVSPTVAATATLAGSAATIAPPVAATATLAPTATATTVPAATATTAGGPGHQRRCDCPSHRAGCDNGYTSRHPPDRGSGNRLPGDAG